MLGNNGNDYLEISKQIKDETKLRCFDTESGLYADSPSMMHFAQHPQIWAVLCGLESGERAKNLLKKSMNHTSKAASAYMFFLFRALEKAGIYEWSEESLNLLRSLVSFGCTSTPECVGEDVRCEYHAWSTVEIYEFAAKILGLTYKNNAVYVDHTL